MLSIHQFVPTTAWGDGVTNSVLFVQRLLTQLGYHSQIFAHGIDPALTEQVRPLEALKTQPPDLLLVHHSMGHDLDWVIERVAVRKILVYHNITPSHFFAPHSQLQRYVVKGREQLARWAAHTVGAIALSPYNGQELAALGYAPLLTLPLLVDLERLDSDPPAPPPPSWGLDIARPLLLSVGRLVTNKRPHLLLEALWWLHQLWPDTRKPQLVLAGAPFSQDYVAALRRYSISLGLYDSVIWAGKCAQNHLHWLYRKALAYWCASAHEGFCMPLIEAARMRLPVLAFATSNIPATLGESGLLLGAERPEWLAAATVELATNPALRDQLCEAGERNLARYRAETLLPALNAFITERCQA